MMIRELLKELELTKSEISFLLVDDKEITLMNKKYLGRDRPTDVISFPQDFSGKRTNRQIINLGDVVISLERAGEQSKKYGKTLWEEIKLLIIHGVLHLLDFDDKSKSSKNKMRQMEKSLMKRFKTL